MHLREPHRLPGRHRPVRRQGSLRGPALRPLWWWAPPPFRPIGENVRSPGQRRPPATCRSHAARAPLQGGNIPLAEQADSAAILHRL